jgi:putative addiction module killer protein
MMEIIKTDTFDQWLSGLRDFRAQARITARLDRLAEGNPGDVKPVGDGVSEMRIDYGPGYRVYFMRHGSVVIVLLCGGDKRTQASDIKESKRLASLWRNKP